MTIWKFFANEQKIIKMLLFNNFWWLFVLWGTIILGKQVLKEQNVYHDDSLTLNDFKFWHSTRVFGSMLRIKEAFNGKCKLLSGGGDKGVPYATIRNGNVLYQDVPSKIQ